MTSAVRRFLAPPSSAGSWSNLSNVASISDALCPTPKLKLNEPSSGLTLTVGCIRSPRNGSSAFSRIRSRVEAICS